MDEDHLNAARMIDDQVVGKNGIALGKLRDLLIDSREGRINFACIEIGDEQVERQMACVPWSQLRIASDGELRLDVSLETLVAFSQWQKYKQEES